MPDRKKETKKQHFVPRTYLKAWETKVETLEKPSDKFDGVYVFANGKDIGDGRTRESVLWLRNLYTVEFSDIFYLYNACPKIRKYFVQKVFDFMNEEKVYAKYDKYVRIESKRSVEKYLCQIDDWDLFRYTDDELAKKKAFLTKVYRLKCYLLEDAFDDCFENSWVQDRDGFVEAVKNAFYNTRSLQQARNVNEHSLYQIPIDIAERMLSFSFMLMCRNPNFDLKGFFPAIRDNVLIPSLVDGVDSLDVTQEEAEEIKKDTKAGIDRLVRCLWISELYRIFYRNSKGFYNSLQKYARRGYGTSGFQMIMFERNKNTVPFITSDNPAFEYYNALTVNNYNAIYFPISPDYLLFIAKGDDEINKIGYRMADNTVVKQFNRIIYSSKNEKVISNYKYLVNLI